MFHSNHYAYKRIWEGEVKENLFDSFTSSPRLVFDFNKKTVDVMCVCGHTATLPIISLSGSCVCGKCGRRYVHNNVIEMAEIIKAATFSEQGNII